MNAPYTNHGTTGMKPSLSLVPVALIAALSGCATAPAQPTVQMRPIESYPHLDCQQLSIELVAIGTWEQHQANAETYMQRSASFMSSLDMLTDILGAVGSQVDPSMASLYQANAQSGKLATAQVEASQSEAATHKAGLAKRRAALGQLHTIKRC